MKITTITYSRKFGGARGTRVEEYGHEMIELEVVAEEGEDITTEQAFDMTLELKRVAYKVNAPPKKKEK